MLPSITSKAEQAGCASCPDVTRQKGKAARLARRSPKGQEKK